MVNKAKNLLLPGIKKIGQLSISAKIAVAGAIAIILMSSFVAVSEQTWFCNSCHIMNPFYKSWTVSTHSKENCLECHLKPGFVGHVKGKINGLAQLVDCVVERYGTKPNATVLDLSCLRSDCHSTEKLLAKETPFKKIKFSHKGHIGAVVNGINISCATCHSHFEGNEHFTVNTEACFTCHFLKSGKDAPRVVNTQCKNCHDVPQDVLRRSFVEINHADFISNGANCDDSCHVKQIQQESKVSPSTCLNCHSFREEKQMTTEQLHSVHTKGEKVECFACHGEVFHRTTDKVMPAGRPWRRSR